MSANSSQRYDPVTFFHWMWWRINCLETSPQGFQQLFENVASKVRPDFMKVRAYGNLGDRKCDGLYWGAGVVFQVYSPDELKQADTVKKIEEDLNGAVEEWGDELKKWVFVYNTRRGVGPDIPKILLEQRAKYPNITIEPLSSEALWELLRDLNVQQRAEILGPPSGYEHMFLLPDTVPKEIEKRLQKGRFVVIHDVMSPINVRDAINALKPDKPFGPPFHVRLKSELQAWELATEYQTAIVSDALERARDLLPRFAVFSLAPIPLAIQLGHLFSDRVEVRPFQYDRDRKTWSWDKECKTYDSNFSVEGYPDQPITDPIDVVLRVSLSAKISPEETAELGIKTPCQLDLRVDSPDVMWLCHPEQLTQLSKQFRSVLREIARLAPRCPRIHLFYAGPTGGAIVIGQAINPRMNAPVLLYEYDRSREPRYTNVLTLS